MLAEKWSTDRAGEVLDWLPSRRSFTTLTANLRSDMLGLVPCPPPGRDRFDLCGRHNISQAGNTMRLRAVAQIVNGNTVGG
jgi:hypothetical protein